MKRMLLFFFALSCQVASFAQQKAEAALQKLESEFPAEKIFLQYNKEDFVAGEHIWFKCYAFTGNTYSGISTNLYVELYNQQKQLLDKAIVPLVNGTGEGSFPLDSKWPEGIYYIRAYTLWSLNFAGRFQYLHSFAVYNPESPLQLTPRKEPWTAFAVPESGTLLAGVPNKVAIRLSSKGPLPDYWEAVLVKGEEPQTAIASCRSLNKEVSVLLFTPESQANYQIRITDNEKTVRTINVKASATGILLQAKQTPTDLECNVLFSQALPSGGKYKLLAQMHNQWVYTAVFTPNLPEIKKTIPLDKLTDGILHLTLFNEREQPVAERLVFVDKGEVKKPVITLDTVGLQHRALNKWRLEIDTASSYSFTALVTDGGSSLPSHNFISSLLLFNDIGYAEDPAWYFREENVARKEALDALLITERWRWFSWQDLLSGNFPVITYQPDNYLSFTGTVFLGRKMMLNKPINLIYKFADSSVIFQQVPTDSTGSFTLNGAFFRDSMYVYYQLANKKLSANFIKVLIEDNNRFHKFGADLPPPKYTLVSRTREDGLPLSAQRAWISFTNQQKVDARYKALEEVRVQAKARNVTKDLNDRLSSSAFRSFGERVYDFENNSRNTMGLQDPINWARTNIAGLSSLPNFRGGPLSIYIDEMISDAATASMVPITDIALIKFVPSGTGIAQGNGALLIYTKRGGGGNNSTMMPRIALAGYKKLVPFPQVDYTQSYYTSIGQDARELLYWNSQLVPDGNGQATIRFYNSDVSTRFKLTVMGFTPDGVPVFLEKLISPNKPL